jgi:transcriptional regulator with GAF, ATPase, and Fis domain
VDETLLAETFVAFAETLVNDFDVVDFLSVLANRCVELFDAGDAGIMLADPSGHLQVTASSSHQMRLLELFELQHDEGPCPEAYHAGRPVEVNDLRTATNRWPTFAPEAISAGFLSVFAFPMRLREKTIGALNLIRPTAGLLPKGEAAAAQALADVATIGLLHHRAAKETTLLSEQLQYALNSRIVIEQAKGFVAYQLDLDTDAAFSALRGYSRNHNRQLIEVADAVIDRSLDVSEVAATHQSISAGFSKNTSSTTTATDPTAA